MPSRTTRINEKLVLLPETTEELKDEEAEAVIREAKTQDRSLTDEQSDVLRERGGASRKDTG